MLKNAILKRLQEIKQLHLAADLESLSPEEQEQFLQTLSTDLLKSQQEMFKHMGLPAGSPKTIVPIFDAETALEKWAPRGIEQMVQRKVACLILAGGQGSRLGSSLPKALIPVSPDGKKTLLEIHLEKIAISSTSHQTTIPCAVMTSPENHEQIAQFLQNHRFCGLEEKSVMLMTQNEAPFLDENGNWILKKAGKLASGPDGNGHALHLLKSHGILTQWKALGVEEIIIIPIDNALANPVDPILIGYHAEHPADVTIKVVRRQNSEEKVGIIVRKQNRIEVLEYLELPLYRNQLNSTHPLSKNGSLAHIGIFALNLSFAEIVSDKEFPWHLTHKYDHLTEQWVWKFERFIFDMLSYTQKTNLLLYPREKVYAPLKNLAGDKSLATVQAALQNI